VVTEVLGHGTGTLTVNTSRRVLPEMQRDAVTRLHALVTAATGDQPQALWPRVGLHPTRRRAAQERAALTFSLLQP
jgi:hypothetical protein